MVASCAGSLLGKRDELFNRGEKHRSKRVRLMHKGDNDYPGDFTRVPFGVTEDGSIDASALLHRPLDPEWGGPGPRGGEGWSWDHFESVLATQIESVLALRLGIKERPLRKDPGRLGATLWPRPPKSCSGGWLLQPPDQHFTTSLFQLCEKLENFSQSQETLAASQGLAYLLSAEEHQQLCKMASELLLTHLRHFWIPIAEDTGDLFAHQIAQLEAALTDLAKRSCNAPFISAPWASPELDISKWISEVGSVLGPSTGTLEELHRLTQDWETWMSYCTKMSLALNNPGMSSKSELDLVGDSCNMLYRMQNILNLIRSLRGKLPKIAWYYQKLYGESLDAALEAWSAGSAQQLASLQRLQMIGSQAVNYTINDQQDFRALLKNTMDRFDRPVAFVWQIWKELTICDSYSVITTQQMFLGLVQKLERRQEEKGPIHG